MQTSTASLSHPFAVRTPASWMAAIRVAFGTPAAASPKRLDAQALIELADSYESTQPSYAADLRAAAMRSQPAA
jgi:hypothetical protein